jgi:hypothetical protein
MPCFDDEIDFTPKNAAEANALIGKRVKYLQEQDIDRSGRGMFFPRYGTVTGNKGKYIYIGENLIRPVELVHARDNEIVPGTRFAMVSVVGYLSSFGNVIRNRIGVVKCVSGNSRQVHATWAPTTSRGHVVSGSVEIEDIKILPAEPAAEEAPVTQKPATVKLSWAKKKREAGSWQPPNGSKLSYKGKAVAHTQRDGVKWFWYGSYGGQSRNTTTTPVATEAEAKLEAKTFILNMIDPVAKAPRKPRVKNTEFYVQLTEDSTRTVMELRGPFTESKANRLRNGMSINFNHNRFSVAVVPKSKVKPETLKACGKV